MRTLLTSQRVSKTWSEAIKFSKRLQRNLFLLPIPGDPVIFHHKDPGSLIYQTFFGIPPSMLPKHFHDEQRQCSNIHGAREEVLKSRGYMWTRSVSDPKLVKIDANPMLRALTEYLASNSEIEMRVWERPQASWRRMQMTQPPVKKAYLVSKEILRSEGSPATGLVKSIWTQGLDLGSWRAMVQRADSQTTWMIDKEPLDIELMGSGMLLWKYDERAGWGDDKSSNEYWVR